MELTIEMKNKILSVMCLSLGIFSTNYVLAADGTVNFTGKITDTACTVDTKTVSVNFGTISSQAFGNKAGYTTAPTAFAIKLSTCPASVTGASVRFEGVPDKTNSDLISIGENGPMGIGIALYDENNKVILPNSDSSSYKVVASGSNTLNFVAKLMTTGTTVTTGDINTTSNFTIVYP